MADLNRPIDAIGPRGTMQQKPATRMLVEFELGAVSGAELVLWAIGLLSDGDSLADDLAIIELAGLPTGRKFGTEPAGALLREAVGRRHPTFSVRSEQAESLAMQVFFDQGRRLLDGYIRPFDFCGPVSAIEALYDFPAWLGDAYNHCDWCEPDSETALFSHLLEFVAAHLHNMGEPVTGGLDGLAAELQRHGVATVRRPYFAADSLLAYRPGLRPDAGTDSPTREQSVFLYAKGIHWEARVTPHGGPHWTCLAPTLPDLLTRALEVCKSKASPPYSDRWHPDQPG